MKFFKQRAEASPSPSSSIGIMRFFDADSRSVKISPYFVVGGAIGIIVIMIILGKIM
jgi:preprotein translocase subunit Sec61beta